MASRLLALKSRPMSLTLSKHASQMRSQSSATRPQPQIWETLLRDAREKDFPLKFRRTICQDGNRNHGLPEFWRTAFPDTTVDEFLSNKFNSRHELRERTLGRVLSSVLPEKLEPSSLPRLSHIRTREDFIKEAYGGLKKVPMAVRIPTHACSLIDWRNALNDPIRRQFLPLESDIIPDNPLSTLDSLGEIEDSVADGLIHRYESKALFLATCICPCYCRFCTRSYAVGPSTSEVSKCSQKPIVRRWDDAFDYIRKKETLTDIVVSGGDIYTLEPWMLQYIVETLIDIPHVRQIRIATRGLAAHPNRILYTDDGWAKTVIGLCDQARAVGKHVCLHTHFNHPNEISWITRVAVGYLYANGVVMRNQTVLLRGINDDFPTMNTLIQKLGEMNVHPYYVYQCDPVPGVEDLRTPLSTAIELEKQIRGRNSGFNTPTFVVDLPGGGGKRNISTFDSYDVKTGLSTWTSPALEEKKAGRVYKYWDPVPLPPNKPT